MKTILKSISSFLGYDISISDARIDKSQPFEIYTYYNPDGSLNYEEYKKVQTEGNKKKLDKVWVKEENIKFLSEYLKKNIDNIELGLCHGTRRGKEQEWFSKYLGTKVIGTEISDTANSFPNTIQWDFHETKEDWINNIDFIYSNSFDHSYDPKKCINAWMDCLKKNGICILEHSSSHEKANKLDPFGAKIVEMPYLILDWSGGRFFVSEILNAPSVSDKNRIEENITYIKYLIIRKAN